ncbi:gyf domain-containing protein [Cladorrhinum sp. PSN259]|nr:gyf domain-containing protein [Cladorrhinum sp. PSN259]
MPSGLPSSFASAAAGQARDSRGTGRNEVGRGTGSGDWPRSNGTRTFRRSSTTHYNQNSASNPSDLSHNSVSDLSSYQAASPDSAGDMVYSREDLFDIYRNNSATLQQIDASSLFEPSWHPEAANGGHSTRSWGKTGESGHTPQDPTVCWDANGNVRPVGLEEMTAEERLLFTTDVNSTLKPPQPKQQLQEGTQGAGGVNGRKTSVSAGNYPLVSPSTSRPGTRRRETADTNPFPNDAVASPTSSRFRNEQWFSRRSTELNKESTITDEPEDDTNPRETSVKTQPFGLLRTNTSGSTTAFGNASSLWGPNTPTASSGIGAFGSFALPTPPAAEKRFPASGSRLAHLMTKDPADSSSAPKPLDAASWRPRQRTDTDPFAGDDSISGSAILGGAQDSSPPAQAPRGSIFDTPVKGSAGEFGMAGLNLGERGHDIGPTSPSETNPYRSPQAERGEEGQNDHDGDRNNQPGSATTEAQQQHQGHQQPQQHSTYNTLPRSFGATAFDGSDRSQTSSVGAMSFPAHNNSLGGWPAATSVGTPDRERLYNPFGATIFNSPSVDLPSPGLGGLGGVFGVPNTARVGRGKLGSLFPAAMQAQMHHEDQDGLGDSIPDLRQPNTLGAIGRGSTIGMQPRDTGSPIRGIRAGFEDMFAPPDAARSPFSTAEQGQPGLTATAQAQAGFPATAGSAFPPIPSSADPVSGRQMVMPDRMRWVYLDPQGTTQGPFSGLEMNDWYKANFFSPDLRVKKLEDSEFEPLGQLIRRIGNSREPFLVPQIGIPHGPSPQSGPFATGGNAAEVIPPLQSAFPSFGRTLTAAQQNDLERRKQEEQMFHARQRELLQNQQYNRHPMQPGLPTALHHHSSIQSLQSQPSFGSMTSPIALAQVPLGPIGPGAAAYFDSASNMALGPVQAPIGPSADLFAPDLNMGERQVLANMVPANLQNLYAPQPAAHPADNGHQSQLPSVDQLQQDSQGFSARLKEFHELRAQHDADEAAAAAAPAAVQSAVAALQLRDGLKEKEQAPVEEEEEEEEELAGASLTVTEVTVTTTETVSVSEPAVSNKKAAATTQAKQEMSLTEKVRKTQADNAKSAQEPTPSGLPMPFPPPQTTPLAAPTAQRPASNLPNRYGDRSASGTPDTASEGAPLQPPPTAPWAALSSGAEAHKGPSLKEIQEAEAKKAAKKEEAAAAARRAAMEQEAAALREREKVAAAITTGLPATSTWGTNSPVGAPAGSPWKQPAAPKAPVSSSAGSKKTLAEIQREEELRKQKSQQAAVQASAVSGATFGKRYADLASKSSASVGASPSPAASQASVGGGWSTVGAGGKVKIPPTGPAAQVRSASTTGVKPTPVPVVKAAPKPAASHKDVKAQAREELRKWVIRELSRGGIVGVDVDTAATLICEMDPGDQAVREIAYQNKSPDFDPARFINDLVIRKKNADKGIILDNDASTGAESNSGGNGGWSEVAKKGDGLNGHSSSSLDQQLRDGQYLDILLSESARNIIAEFVRNLTQPPSTTTTPAAVAAAENASSDHGRITVGLAAFNAFLQANVTGPALDDSKLSSVEKLFCSSSYSSGGVVGVVKLKQVRKLCLSTLEVDGVSPYPYIPLIELFSLARFLLLDSSSGSNLNRWLALRIRVWHYKLLTQPSLGGAAFTKAAQWCDVPTLQGEIEKGMDEVEESGELKSEKEKVEFQVEKANVCMVLGQDLKAREAIKEATRLSGFVFALSGALAKRTKFQERSTSHLVVLARSKEQSSEETKKENGGDGEEKRPEALRLNDDTLLEELAFEKTKTADETKEAGDIPQELRDLSPDEQPQLSPLDQIILLAEATLKDSFSPSDTLTSEEVLPFAVRVISDKATNWQIYTHALLVRSRIEVHRSRTMERGVLQMQAVVDQVVVDTMRVKSGDEKRAEQEEEVGEGIPRIQITGEDGQEEKEVSNPVSKPTSFFPAAKPDESAPAQVRLEFIHALSSPPRWHLECELAYSWANVGSLVSALEIFKRLRLWAEVALCYASSAQRDDEGGRGKDGEAKAKAILRWRLFQKTGTSSAEQQPEEDEDADVDDLKEADYHGPARQPPPPNAPRLLCILGDIDNDPKHYERAWEISKNRFARAQKSLGEYYLQQKDIVKARDSYTKAVAVNRLSSELWNRLGDISLRLGEFSDASEAFGRAIACSDANGGEDARTWSNLGSALYSLYVERVKELKKEGGEAKVDVEGEEVKQLAEDEEEEEDVSAVTKKTGKASPSELLTKSLAAYKKGASVSHDNWRIWDNVITLGSRLRPIATQDVLLALQHVVRIRNTEDALDIDVLRLLLNDAVLSVTKPDGQGQGVYDPPRGSVERSVCEFLENSVVPLITIRSELWELITRERVWKRDFPGAVDAAEKAWRAAMGGAGTGGLSAAAAVTADGKSRNWLEDKEAWSVVVERTDELVSVLENYGEEIPSIGGKWKGKARLAVRSVMGKGKEAWEGGEEWERLVGLLEGLKA